MDLPTKIDFAKVNCRPQLDRANCGRSVRSLGVSSCPSEPANAFRVLDDPRRLSASAICS